MNMIWINDKKMRNRVGSDLLLSGEAFVVENDDGTRQMMIPSCKMDVLIEKGQAVGPSTQMPKIVGYRANFREGRMTYKPEHVWHGHLERVSPPRERVRRQ